LAIKNFNELYWKLFNIAGGGSEPDVTKVLDSIVKSDRSKLDQYFTNAVDQIAFDTQDWKRMRSFFIDLFAAHRSLITQAAGISDPHFLTNSELDELFRSFGYPESVRLQGFDENPLENKVQLFLDLVNLYKIKGTPRSILEVLQYYGIPELDIFEFWLQKKSEGELEFKGEAVAGTTVDPSPISLPFDLLTLGDPHWMMSESKVLQLDALNKINLPSKTPYFAVQPSVEIGIENAILVRLVQDQYQSWYDAGAVTKENLPPQDADITILGVTASLLELYLLTLYSFHKDYEIGSAISKFACYDGTNTSTVDIVEEYEEIISGPITRSNKDSKYTEYLDLFTRVREDHFLYNYNDATSNNSAELALNDINPDLIADLNSLTSDNATALQSLLKDLAVWVRNNVGFGFVNLGYIFFGLNQLFEDLKPVINFFKPYRARLVVLELLNFRNQLTESIPTEDLITDFEIGFDVNDYMTANSSPCCTVRDEPDICLDSTAGTFYSRNTYDCGSYHDIGAVDDPTPIEMIIEQNVCDDFRCPPGCAPDSTDTSDVIVSDVVAPLNYRGVCDRLAPLPANFDGTTSAIIAPDSTDCTDLIPITCQNAPYVFSEVIADTIEHIEDLVIGTEEFTVLFPEEEASTDYILNVNLFNEWVGGKTASMYGIIITQKATTGFTVAFSSPLDRLDYKLSWSVNPSATNRGTEILTQGADIYTVSFDVPFTGDDYAIGTCMVNIADDPPSMYQFVVTEKDNNGFTMQFNSPIDSTNYTIDWNIFDSTSFIPNGLVNIPYGADEMTVYYPSDNKQQNDIYALSLTMINTDDATASVYSYLLTKKDNDNFTVAFSSPIDSTNYYLSYAITHKPVEEFVYRQESGFRLYDTMGRFDCTHGFDSVEIELQVLSQQGVILQENDGWLLLEDGGGILW